MRTPTLLVLLVAAAHSAAFAQLDPHVKVGARVRVNSPDAQIIGRIAGFRDDTIIVDRGPADTARAVSLRDVTELAVYARAKGGQGTAVVFAAIGAVSGAALYASWCAKDPEGCRRAEPVDVDPYDDEEPMPLAVTATLGFAAIGLLLGQSLAPRRWEIVELPVRIGVVPSPAGVAAYVSLPAPRFVRGSR